MLTRDISCGSDMPCGAQKDLYHIAFECKRKYIAFAKQISRNKKERTVQQRLFVLSLCLCIYFPSSSLTICMKLSRSLKSLYTDAKRTYATRSMSLSAERTASPISAVEISERISFAILFSMLSTIPSISARLMARFLVAVVIPAISLALSKGSKLPSFSIPSKSAFQRSHRL